MARSLRGESLIYLAGTIGSSFFLYLTIPIYTRAFTPAQYGALSMVTALIGVIGGVLILGGDTALSRFWFQESDSSRRGRLALAWIAFLAALAVVVCLVLALLAPVTSPFILDGVASSWLLVIALATLPFAQTSRLVSQVLRNQFRAWTYATSAILLGMLTAALGVGLAVGTRLGLVGVVLGTLLSELIILSVRLFQTRHTFSFGVDWSRVKPMLRFGAPLVPVSLSFWVFAAANRLVLGHFGGLTELGYFAVASSVTAAFALVTGAVSQAWVPRAFSLYEADQGLAARQIGRFLTAYLALLGTLAVLASSLAPEIVSLIATPQYAAAARAIPVLAVGSVAFGAQLLTASGLTLTNRTKSLALLSVSAAVVDVGLAMALIPTWGVMGAAVAGASGYVLLAVLFLVFSQRAWPIALERRSLALTCGSLLAATLALTALTDEALWIRLTCAALYAASMLPIYRRFAQLRNPQVTR